MRNVTFAVTLVLLSAPLFPAERLPRTVVPTHYDIRISTDLAGETFSGEETVDLDVLQPASSIRVHSVGLDLRNVSVSAGGTRLEAQVRADEPNEMVVLELPKEIPAGDAQLSIGFAGRLAENLHGLYLSRTAKRKYAATQFEATSARRAFPCFDEPAMKATFDIALVVDRGDTAISNTPVVSDTPVEGGKHAIRFATTKRLPTYLLAFLVGDFECIHGSADAVPIRVCSTPGFQHLGRFALEAARASISYFDRYYGIPYPFGKLDLIGIPDFAAGAMENAGAVTFREVDLLIDEKTASPIVQKRVAKVVAHEIAHMWFGDLVTMAWWNDVWLNEGFAAFMETRPIEAWKPEWRSDLDVVARTTSAMTADARAATPAIRSEDSFDSALTYDKTASVLRMVEEWMGPEAFRDAIRAYLKKYSWSNASADEFWAAMVPVAEHSDVRPPEVAEVLKSFIDQGGFPLVHFSETCDGGIRRATLGQERMVPAGMQANALQTWVVPVCSRELGAPPLPCRVIAGPAGQLDIRTSCARPLFLRRAGAGFFAVDYPAEERLALRRHLAELTDAERLALQGNEWLLARNVRRDAGEYLRLLDAMPRRPNRPLVTAISESLVLLHDRLAGEQNRAEFGSLVHRLLRGYAPATWKTPANETDEQRLIRSTVLWTLGYVGEDRKVVDEARTVAEKYIRNPSSTDALIADTALRLSAVNGDEAFFDRVVAQMESAPTPELEKRYRSLLPLFRDPKIAQRAIGVIFSDKVRVQDRATVLASMFDDPATRSAGWQAITSRWQEMQKGSAWLALRALGGAAAFCDATAQKAVESFFAEHPGHGVESIRSRVVDSISTCIAFRTAQQRTFDNALGELRVAGPPRKSERMQPLKSRSPELESGAR